MSWRNRVHSKWRKINVIDNDKKIMKFYDVDEAGRLKQSLGRQKRRILHAKYNTKDSKVNEENDFQQISKNADINARTCNIYDSDTLNSSELLINADLFEHLFTDMEDPSLEKEENDWDNIFLSFT